MLRGLLAPIAALAGASLLLVYLASCSTDKEPAVPSTPAMKEVGEGGGDEVARAETFTEHLPEIEVSEPPPPPGEQPAGPRVEDVLSKGCSTTVVKGLSEQIVAEANCITPGAYAKLPLLSNVALSDAVFPYMQEPARNALVKALKKAKSRKMKVNSMLRTVAQQFLLYDWWKRKRCGIKLAAEPGTSNHQGGLAIDISEPGNWRKTLTGQGFRWMGKRDPWHFDFKGDEAEDRSGIDVKAFQRLWNRNHPDQPIGDDGDWGPETEEALRASPADGFAVGAQCAEEIR